MTTTRPGPRAKARPTVFDNFHRGLLQVHGELREGAARIVASVAPDGAAGDTATLIAGFCQTLLDHHKSEDRFFFPAFRGAGGLRSSDVAFLEQRDAEHLEIHRLCLELQELGQRGGSEVTSAWRASVGKVAGDLAAASLPHFAEEEATLTPTHVATLLSSQQLVNVFRDMGMNWHRR
jgi:hypothetical protein